MSDKALASMRKWSIRLLLAVLIVSLFGPMIAYTQELIAISPVLIVSLPMVAQVIVLLTWDNFRSQRDIATLQAQVAVIAKHIHGKETP